MSKFYLLDKNYNVFTGFEIAENDQKMYCYQEDIEDSTKFFRSIEQIITYFKNAKMPLFPTQHKVLEYNTNSGLIYHII